MDDLIVVDSWIHPCAPCQSGKAEGKLGLIKLPPILHTMEEWMTLKRMAIRSLKHYSKCDELFGTGPFSACERRWKDVQRMVWFLWEQKDGRRFIAEEFNFIHSGD